MFGFINNYKAKLPNDELIFDAYNNLIGDTGKWCKFFWDTISEREYLQAPSGWFDFSKFLGSDLIISGVARSSDGKRVIKVEFLPHYRKQNNLQKEAEIIEKLNHSNCVSAPKLLSKGKLSLDAIYNALPANHFDFFKQAGILTFHYLTIEYIDSSNKAPIADILISILEQKNLGIYHSDVKPANLRFDDKRGVCMLIDYDQAIELSPDVKNLNAKNFLEWCDVQDKSKYPSGPGTWRRHFKRLRQKLHIAPLLKSGALDLTQTTPYKRQATTNTKNGVYHTIKHPDVFAEGVRDLHDRTSLLDRVEFFKGESVLDVGCNAGLLVHYLASRGCSPTGIEMDPSIVVSAQMIANIMGVKANFFSQDIDDIIALDKFDTICLFSVIHHTRMLEENGRKIAFACRRILIECRLTESGKKPIFDTNGKVKWVKTSVWDYPDENALFSGMNKLFPGFMVTNKIGNSGKNRILIEMKRV